MHRRGGVCDQAHPSRVEAGTEQAVWDATETLLLAVSRTRAATREGSAEAVRATPSAAFAPPVTPCRSTLLEWECLPGAAHAHLLTQLRSPVAPVQEQSVRAAAHALLDGLVAPVREPTVPKQHRTPRGPYSSGPLLWGSTLEAVVSRPLGGWLNPYPPGTPLAKLCDAKRAQHVRDKRRRLAVESAVEAALTGVLAVSKVTAGAARANMAKWSDMQAVLEEGVSRDAELRAQADAHGARLDRFSSSLQVSLTSYRAEAARLR